MNLKAKFLIPALLLIVTGMATTTYFSYSNSTASLTGLTKTNAKAGLSSLLSLVDVWIDGTRNQIITLSGTSLVLDTMTEGPGQSAARESLVVLLKDIAKRHPALDNILIVGAQGKVLTDSKQALSGVDLTGREYFKQAMQGQVFLSKPILASDSGVPVFVIASPVISKGKVC